MVLLLGALGVAWFVLRILAGKADERRRQAREERMAALYEERERLLAENRAAEGPSSIAAVVSDAAPPSLAAREVVKVRCRACGALEDEKATRCGKCGADL